MKVIFISDMLKTRFGTLDRDSNIDFLSKPFN